jgi:gamma-glutamylcyclotransferase (GGCT)/AIG2-like uncharacterized protein YtfP
MSEHIFFYGTLMEPFHMSARRLVEEHLCFVGRGRIHAALFDLGFYPGAVPSEDGVVVGEVQQMLKPAVVLRALDEFEGCRPTEPDLGLFVRTAVEARLDDGSTRTVWVYFYNAPLGQASQIESGDYLQHLRPRLPTVVESAPVGGPHSR